MILAKIANQTAQTVTQTGIGLGSAIAVVCSWERNRSILWAIVAGLFSWIYVINARESRGLTGFSMGGWGTMHLAFKFPDVFSVAVAQAGRYDSRSQQADAPSRELARFHPTSFRQYMAVGEADYMLCAFQVLFAGLLPNPQRPYLYTDDPYEWVDGQPVLIESADQRCRQGDVQNGDLPRYLLQPIRLNGIKIVHGTTDSASPVIHTRECTNALDTAGVQFEYEEHSGGHEYRAAMALPFLSSHLQGAERYIEPARLTLSLATNGLQLVFSTQTNLQYTVESAAELDTSDANWTERTRVTGDGQTATVESPCQGEAQFFRIRAANLHQNPVKHGLVPVANQYPWCSAAWFERETAPAMVKAIYRFKIDQVNVYDDFNPEGGW